MVNNEKGEVLHVLLGIPLRLCKGREVSVKEYSLEGIKYSPKELMLAFSWLMHQKKAFVFIVYNTKQQYSFLNS